MIRPPKAQLQLYCHLSLIGYSGLVSIEAEKRRQERTMRLNNQLDFVISSALSFGGNR